MIVTFFSHSNSSISKIVIFGLLRVFFHGVLWLEFLAQSFKGGFVCIVGFRRQARLNSWSLVRHKSIEQKKSI